MKYSVIRSDRKTLAIQVKNGEVIIRSPRRKSEREIGEFVERNRAWIEKTVAEQKKHIDEDTKKLDKASLEMLMEYARQVIPQRVAYYAKIVGVCYQRVTIKVLRSKWGSCSGKGNLNFNCLLMLAPSEVIDSVVVHELCHLKQMNHSDKFYREVLRVYPDYYKWHSWLKEHGSRLIRSIPEDK